MRANLVVEGGNIREGTIFNKVYVEVTQEGTSFFRFGNLVQGFVQIGGAEQRDRCVVPIDASNSEVLFCIVFYFSKDSFTDIFMRYRKVSDWYWLVHRFYVNTSTSTFGGGRSVQEVISRDLNINQGRRFI
jgi:hypothetical protein